MRVCAGENVWEPPMLTPPMLTPPPGVSRPSPLPPPCSRPPPPAPPHPSSPISSTPLPRSSARASRWARPAVRGWGGCGAPALLARLGRRRPVTALSRPVRPRPQTTPDIGRRQLRRSLDVSELFRAGFELRGAGGGRPLTRDRRSSCVPCLAPPRPQPPPQPNPHPNPDPPTPQPPKGPTTLTTRTSPRRAPTTTSTRAGATVTPHAARRAAAWEMNQSTQPRPARCNSQLCSEVESATAWLQIFSQALLRAASVLAGTADAPSPGPVAHVR